MSVQSPVSSLERDDRQRMLVLERLAHRLHIKNNIASIILALGTAVGALLFLSIIIDLLITGVPYLINPDFYGNNGTGTVGQQIFNTLYILVFTEIILVPIALAAAIYLVEYARQGPFVTVVHFAAETLAGVPSLVLGLFGYLIFSTVLGFGLSRLSGVLTLLCLNFPIALRLFEDGLVAVTREQREGGLALGSTRWHMILDGSAPFRLTRHYYRYRIVGRKNYCRSCCDHLYDGIIQRRKRLHTQSYDQHR